MQVDFYQLSRDPVERVVPLLAGKVLESGARLAIAARDEALRNRLSDALWAQDPPAFLANGMVGEAGADRQPILIGETCERTNDATMTLLADGEWREEAAAFERAILLFDDTATDAARDLWRKFAGRDNIERRFFKQDERGRWKLAG